MKSTPTPTPLMSAMIIQVLVTISFLIGIFGNIAALVILYRSAKRRNRKHVLMLRWLAINDLTAAIGMLTFTNVKRYAVLPEEFSCTVLVLLRGFGLGSGCVAFTMALERWLALTRPFLYHKVVTYDVLKRTLFCLWLGALLLSWAPLLGFGLYYDKEHKKCARYRFGVLPKDKIYAWCYFSVGLFACLCLTLCNIAVVLELSKIRQQNRMVVRRISRSLIVNNRAGCPRHHQTPEEVAFAKLMAYISIIFLVCWGPQVITISIAQLGDKSKASQIFTGIADMLMAFYFTLDPFVYVLQRYIEKGTFGLTWCFLKKQRSTSSLPTTTTTTTTNGGGGGGTPTSTLITSPSFPAPSA